MVDDRKHPWETYLRGGRCIPLRGHTDTCLFLPRSPRWSWTALHPHREKKTQHSLHNFILNLLLALKSKPLGLLLDKHREVWRRSFRRRTGESRCIAAGSGCDCSTRSAENRREEKQVISGSAERTHSRCTSRIEELFRESIRWMSAIFFKQLLSRAFKGKWIKDQLKGLST